MKNGIESGRRPLDPLSSPVEEVVRDPIARFDAKQASAVIFASRQIANGVPLDAAVETAKRIMSLQGRAAIARTLENARKLVKPPPHRG